MAEADLELVKRAKAGDRSAFDELVGPLIGQAFRLAFGMLHDRAAAEDAVQEAAVRSWRKLNNLRPGNPLRPWFLAIVANQCRRAMRDRWWSVLKRSDLTALTQQVDAALVDEAETLRQGLLRLSVRDRLVVVLRYYLDLSFEEVAATLRVSPSAARVRAHRALARLRGIIDIPEESA